MVALAQESQQLFIGVKAMTRLAVFSHQDLPPIQTLQKPDLTLKSVLEMSQNAVMQCN